MNHPINSPIEVKEMQGTLHHVCDVGVKLCFLYPRGLAVGNNAEVRVYGLSIIGETLSCIKIKDNLYKCEIIFSDEICAHRLRMLEQAILIEKYQEVHPELSANEAAVLWINKNGAEFPEK